MCRKEWRRKRDLHLPFVTANTVGKLSPSTSNRRPKHSPDRSRCRKPKSVACPSSSKMLRSSRTAPAMTVTQSVSFRMSAGTSEKNAAVSSSNTARSSTTSMASSPDPSALFQAAMADSTLYLHRSDSRPI